MKPDEQLVTLEFSKITDNIYIGSNACCQIRFAEPLIKEGITANLSLEEDRVDMPFGVAFYLWLPVTDMFPPSVDQFEVGVAYMAKVIALGHKVLVHCKWGHGRGPTMVAAYLISTGMSVDEAIALMTKKRSVVHLETVQIAALRQFALLPSEPVILSNIHLSVREAADILSVKRQWVYENIKRGKIKAQRIGNHVLITRKELERFIASRRKT